MHAHGRCCAPRLLVSAYLVAFQLGRVRSFSESTPLLRSCLPNLLRTVAASHRTQVRIWIASTIQSLVFSISTALRRRLQKKAEVVTGGILEKRPRMDLTYPRVSKSPLMSSDLISVPPRPYGEHSVTSTTHVRQGNDYQNVTVGEGSRAVLGNVYAESFSMNIVGHSQRPQKTEHEEREDFMRSLGFDVMDSRLATIGIAYQETCSWLYTRAEYLRWQDPEYRASHHGFLWIKGKPGAGKSTLMKHALRHAKNLDQRDTTTISFFFNARGHELEKTTEGMYRSLLHQVYNAFPDRLPKVLPGHFAEWKDHIWKLPELQDMLREALLAFGNSTQFVCYIDALDECDEDSIRLAIDYFEELGELAILKDVKLSICFASRHYPNITMRRCQPLNLDEQGDHQKDIQKFVRGKLRGTGRTHHDLSEEISFRSSGVFLWAALVVQILNKQMDHGASRSQLMTALKAVPTEIEGLLRNMLMDGGVFLLPTLLWVLFAHMPLDASMLYHAIMIGANQLTAEDWDKDEITQEQIQLFILNSSKGLVEFSKGGYASAQFIHESVREYLLNGGLSILDDSLAENVRGKSHLRLATWCRNCIELISDRDFCNLEIEDNGLVVYALLNFHEHCGYAWRRGAFQLESLDTVPQSTNNLICRTLGLNESSSLMRLLFALGAEELIEGLLRRQLRSFPKSSHDQANAYATARNYAIDTVVPYFDVNERHDANDITLLLLAMRGRFDTLVELLLACGADPDLGYSQGTPLLAALRMQNHNYINILLHHGANPNFEHVSSETRSAPLTSAVEEESAACVEALLKGGADANGCNAERGKPLTEATITGQRHVVRLLLAHGADPDGSSYHRPLHSAVSHRDESMFRLLLEAGADIRTKDEANRTLLHIWCLGGELPLSGGMGEASLIAKVLLDTIAELSATDETRSTAFIMAAGAHSPSRVKSLIDGGFKVNATNSTCETALIAATKSGVLSVVQVLLDAGADINAIDGSQRTALIMAVEMGNFDIARLLVDRGARLDMPGHEEVVRYLRLRMTEEDAARSTAKWR